MFTVAFLFVSVCMHGYEFLSRDFADRREILHGGSAISLTGFLLYWRIAPCRTLGVNMPHVGMKQSIEAVWLHTATGRMWTRRDAQ